jgi:hypothetical protein
MLGKISLGSVGLVVGGILTFMGFAAYFTDHPTVNLIGFFYGIPLLLGGLSLKVTELKPVPLSQETPADVVALREQQSTATQTQIRKDVTRYRYGERAHLNSSLSHLGLSPTDEERPVLMGLREEAIDGAYALILEFDSPMIGFDTWRQKREKMEQFFGPGVRVDLGQPAEKEVEVALIAAPPVPVSN